MWEQEQGSGDLILMTQIANCKSNLIVGSPFVPIHSNGQFLCHIIWTFYDILTNPTAKEMVSNQMLRRRHKNCYSGNSSIHIFHLNSMTLLTNPTLE